MTTIEVLKQALEAFDDRSSLLKWQAAREALRQAIAELESQEPVRECNSIDCQYIDGFGKTDCDWCRPKKSTHPPQRTEQEPVAWRTFDGEGQYEYRAYEENESYADEWDKRNPNHKGWVDPLYTHPPQRTWVGLTDEEIARACGWGAHGWWTHPMPYEIKIAKAIEAKLKEKKT